MKINPNLPSVGASEVSSRTKATGQTQRKESQAADQVELSVTSSQVQNAGGVTADSSVVDASRVAEIKQAMSEGRFQINPERIADGLIDSVKQLLARQRP